MFGTDTEACMVCDANGIILVGSDSRQQCQCWMERSSLLLKLMKLMLFIQITLLIQGCNGLFGSNSESNSGGNNDSNEYITKIITTMDDVFVFSQVPDTNHQYGTDYCPNCGNVLKLAPEGWYGETRILLKFWLADIPQSAVIISAELHFTDLEGAINNDSGTVFFTINRITEVWFQSTTTWNNKPNFDTSPLVSGSITGAIFNTTIQIPANLVEYWIQGTVRNDGIIIVPTGSTGSGFPHKMFPSYENDGRGVFMGVTYKLP